MLDKNGFDEWAKSYDMTVSECEQDGTYPFAAYSTVIRTVYSNVHDTGAKKLLDIGFGTGMLTRMLYADGLSIFGIDFSDTMIELAQKQMPNATLIRADFSKELPKQLLSEQFDCVIATYSIHHVNDTRKVELFSSLLQNNMRSGGIIIIGDVMFKNAAARDACRNECGDGFDTDEHYIIVDEFEKIAKGMKMTFHECSYCSGVLIIEKGADTK